MRHHRDCLRCIVLTSASVTLLASLPVRSESLNWAKLPSLPDPEEFAGPFAGVSGGALLVAGAHGGSFFLFSGAALKAGPDGKPVREWLRDVPACDPKTDQWQRLGEVLMSLVTTPAIGWNGRIVIPGGEVRPGVRSTEVWSTPLW